MKKCIQVRLVQLENEKEERWLLTGPKIEYPRPFVKGIEAVAVVEFLRNPTLNSKKFDFKTATLSQYFKSAHEYKFENRNQKPKGRTVL
jgi:hypothetical protein